MIIIVIFKPAPPVMSEEDVEEFSRMFPGVEKSLIKVKTNTYLTLHYFIDNSITSFSVSSQ